MSKVDDYEKHSEELFQIGEVTKIIGITRKALSGSIQRDLVSAPLALLMLNTRTSVGSAKCAEPTLVLYVQKPFH